MTTFPSTRASTSSPGTAKEIAPRCARICAGNAGPFTFKGTVTYIVGRGKVAIIDPGPDDARHIKALLDAVAGETVTHIVLTHTHRDHSPAAAGAEGRDRRADLWRGAAPRLAAAAYRRDQSARCRGRHGLPARSRARGRRDRSRAQGWTLEAVTTPGHCANHMAYALKETERAVLRRSCDGLVDLDRGAAGRRDERLHGLALQARGAARRRSISPATATSSATRRVSCKAISVTGSGARNRSCTGSARARADIPTLVRAIYIGIDPRLIGAAGLVGAGASGRSGRARHGRDRRRALDRGALPLGLRRAPAGPWSWAAGLLRRGRSRSSRSSAVSISPRRSSRKPRMREALLPMSWKP